MLIDSHGRQPASCSLESAARIIAHRIVPCVFQRRSSFDHMKREDAVYIPANKKYRYLAFVCVPLAIYGFFHIHDYHFYRTVSSMYYIAIMAIGLLLLSGIRYKIDAQGISKVVYGVRIRFIAWNSVEDVLCYPLYKDTSFQEIRKVDILIRLKGCRGVIPSAESVRHFHELHLRKTLYIDHGDYSNVFRKYAKTQLLPGWAESDASWDWK